MEPLDLPPTAPDPATRPTPEARSSWRPNRLTSGIVAGGAAFAMVLAGLGIASAQTDGSTTTTSPAASAEGRPHHPHGIKIAIDTAAKTLGISEGELRSQLQAGKSLAEIAGDKTDALIAALVADAQTHLDQAVADGKLTQAQADERKATLTERMTALVNRTPPADGERGPGRPGHGPDMMKPGLAAAATALGISEDELRTQLQSGKTIAQVAQDKGVDVNKVITALVDEAKARLAQAVTDGKLTQAQADARSAELTQRITDMVNRTGPAGGHHHHGPGDGDGPDGGGDVTPESAPASVTA
jgi:cytochrome c553